MTWRIEVPRELNAAAAAAAAAIAGATQLAIKRMARVGGVVVGEY